MKLPENQGKCLDAMLAMCQDSEFGYDAVFPFASISRRSGLPVDEVRRKVRALKRRGLASFHIGLWTIDGEPAGSGYGLTNAGCEAANARVKPVDFLKGDGK
jgi:hypothetical protein